MPFTVTVSATVPPAPKTAEPVMAAVVEVVGPGWNRHALDGLAGSLVVLSDDAA